MAWAASVDFRKGDILRAVNNQIAKASDLERATPSPPGYGESSRCGAASRSNDAPRISPSAHRKHQLFDAAGMEQEAPRPLADRLRARALWDVVGQDHLTGDDGVLSRCWRRERRVACFVGASGDGQETMARLLAEAPDCLWSIFQRFFPASPT